MHENRSRVVDLTMIELVVFLLFVSFLYIAAQSVRSQDNGADIPPDTTDTTESASQEPDSLSRLRAYGEPPCVFRQDSGSPVAQYKIKVQPGGFQVERAWDDSVDSKMQDVPGATRFVDDDGLIDSTTFANWGNSILRYSQDPDNAFGRSCRMYAEIRYTSRDQELAQRRRKDVVTGYFWPSNSTHLRTHFR
jgi:hypothetical protein